MFYQIRDKLLIICVALQILNTANAENSKSTYDFPPLYDFDDYDACLHSNTSKFGSTYCMVYAEIQPQNSSNLWRQISEHIEEYKFHFRRDRLFIGVCMERCKHFPKSLDHFQYNDSKVTNQITQFFEVVHKRPVDLQMRTEHHALVHNCLNSEFQDKYGLSLKTYIEYCERSEAIIEQDGAEKIIYKLIEIILLLNILSSLYDFCLKRKQPVEHQNTNFYKINLEQPVAKLLTSFSIRRNYYRLVEPYANQLGKELNYLDGIRSFCVIIVVTGHAFFVQYHHVKNPDMYERFAKRPFHLSLANGTLILEIFHVLSGLLLLLKFKDSFTITSQSSAVDCIKTFWKGMLLRYIRFLPSMAFFIFVNATFFTRLQDGPFWRHLTEPGRTFGREKWFKNLLTFDNISESGFPHTWYMTTDCQLFAFYFCIIIAINKYPQYKTKILSALAVLAILIPVSISYFYGLEPCYIIAPESFRYIHVMEDREFFQLYTPFYTNLGGYLFGIVCGELYENYSHNEKLRKQITGVPTAIFEIAFWAFIAIGLWICWIGPFIIFKVPSIWTALFAGLNRNLWLLIVCGGLILMGMFCKSLSALNFLSHSAFRVLARLSFQIYVWHFSVLYLMNGHKRDPVFTNHFHHFTLMLCIFLFSTALAFMVTIFVEYPVHQIMYYLFKKGTRSKGHQLKLNKLN